MSWNVLLLDEDPRSREELRQGLCDIGCEVRLVADKQALANAKSLGRLLAERFDAVLVSVAPPLLAGLRLVDLIRDDAKRHGMPIILVGSDLAALSRHEASASPVEGYIPRSADPHVLMAELDARLEAILGRPASEPAAEDSLRGADGLTLRPPATRGMDAESTVTTARATASRPAVGAGATEKPPPVGGVTRAATGAPEDLASRIQQLELELVRALELRTAAAQQHRAVIAELRRDAAAKAEEAHDVAEGRAMAEASLTMIAGELDMATKKLAAAERELEQERAARAHADQELEGERTDHQATSVLAKEELRAAEKRFADERARAAVKLSAAEAAFDRKQRELEGLRDTATKQTAALEKDLNAARAARDEAKRAFDAEKASSAAAAVLAQEKLHVAERTLTEERERATVKLTAAEAAFTRKQRELVETEEVAGKKTSAIENELGLAHAARDKVQQDLDAERKSFQKRLRDSEDRLRDDGARAAAERKAATAVFDAKLQELVLARDGALERAGRLEEELGHVTLARDDVARERDHLVTALDGERRSREAARLDAAERLRVATERHSEERARAASALEAKERELVLTRATATEESNRLEEEARVARATQETLVARLEGLQRELDVARRGHDAERTGHAATRETTAKQIRTLEDDARLAVATRERLEAEREDIERSLEAERRSHEAERASHAATREGTAARILVLEEEARAAGVSEEAVAAARDELQRALEEERRRHAANLEAERSSLGLERSAHGNTMATLTSLEARLETALAELTAERTRTETMLADIGRASEAKESELSALREASRIDIGLLDERLRAAIIQRDELSVTLVRAETDLERLRAAAETEQARARAESEALEKRLTEAEARATARETEFTRSHEARETLEEDLGRARLEAARSDEEKRAAIEKLAAELDTLVRQRDEVGASHVEQMRTLELQHAARLQAAEVEHGRARAEADEAHHRSLAALRAELGAEADALSRGAEGRAGRGSTSRPAAATEAKAEPRPSTRQPPPKESSRDPLPRASSRAAAAAERSVARPPSRRAVLVIDPDKLARVDTARALARASCEVTVRDSPAGVDELVQSFDVIVTEVVDVAIDALLEAVRGRPGACAIVAWTHNGDAARTILAKAGVERTAILQKGYRPDGLIKAVRDQLDDQAWSSSSR